MKVLITFTIVMMVMGIFGIWTIKDDLKISFMDSNNCSSSRCDCSECRPKQFSLIKRSFAIGWICGISYIAAVDIVIHFFQ